MELNVFLDFESSIQILTRISKRLSFICVQVSRVLLKKRNHVYTFPAQPRHHLLFSLFSRNRSANLKKKSVNLLSHPEIFETLFISAQSCTTLNFQRR